MVLVGYSTVDMRMDWFSLRPLKFSECLKNDLRNQIVEGSKLGMEDATSFLTSRMMPVT